MVSSVGDWTGLGCYAWVLFVLTVLIAHSFFRSDSVDTRVLPNRHYYTDSTKNTIEACTVACATEGRPYAGVEFGIECCEFLSLSVSVRSPLCSMPPLDCGVRSH